MPPAQTSQHLLRSLLSAGEPRHLARLELIDALQASRPDPASARTALDELLDCYQALPEPKNFAGFLDTVGGRLAAQAGGRS